MDDREMEKGFRQSPVHWHKAPACPHSLPGVPELRQRLPKGPRGQRAGIRRLSLPAAEALGSAGEGGSLEGAQPQAVGYGCQKALCNGTASSETSAPSHVQPGEPSSSSRNEFQPEIHASLKCECLSVSLLLGIKPLSFK